MTFEEKQVRKTAEAGAPRQSWEPRKMSYLDNMVELVQGGGGGDGTLSVAAPEGVTGKKPEGGG